MPPVPVLLPAPWGQEEGPQPGYRCPVYVTAGRWGETNTTGNSTNFIFHLVLFSRGLPPSDAPIYPGTLLPWNSCPRRTPLGSSALGRDPAQG